MSTQTTRTNKYVQLTEWGNPSAANLQLKEEKLDYDSLQSDDILVKMKYACVHPADMNVFLKNYPIHYSVKNNILPTKVGLEGVGVVEKVGKDVKNFQVGDSILPGDKEGKYQAYSQYVITKEGMKVPADVDPIDAAQSYVNPMTAVGLLDSLGIIDLSAKEVNVQEYLVISGANSTVGLLLLQIAKAQGIKTIALVRKDDAVDYVKQYGATEVIVTKNISKAEELTSQLQKVAQDKGIRYGIDCVGGYITEGIFDSLGLYGHLMYYGNLSRQDIIIKAFSYRTLPKLEGFNVGLYFRKVGPQRQQEAINFVFKELESKKLQFLVEKIYPFEQYLDAFKAQVEGTGSSRKGKFLLKID